MFCFQSTNFTNLQRNSAVQVAMSSPTTLSRITPRTESNPPMPSLSKSFPMRVRYGRM